MIKMDLQLFGGRGTSFSGSRSTVDTSYQGKQYAKAAGRGQTVDTMVSTLSSLGSKTLAGAPEAVQQINKVAGNPNATITIYRATIGNSINQNDWVFLDKKQADKWTKTPLGRPKPGVKVITKRVKAKTVDWTGKNLEFVYLGR